MVRCSLGVLSLFVLVGAGCSTVPRTVAVSKLQPPYRFMVYEGGTPVSEGPVAPGSLEEQEVTRWLQSHSTDWHRTFVTYAPSHLIRGDDFNLDFRGDECVLNYRVNSRDDWTQVCRSIDRKELIPSVLNRND